MTNLSLTFTRTVDGAYRCDRLADSVTEFQAEINREPGGGWRVDTYCFEGILTSKVVRTLAFARESAEQTFRVIESGAS